MKATTKTVMFADVKGFSSLSEKQLQSFAENILPDLSDRVFKGSNCGHLNTWGDGFVATFDDVLKACETVLAMRDFFKNYHWNDQQLPTLDTRASLHQGTVYEGEDLLTQRGVVTGRTIIRAARIEPVTLPGQVWVTQLVSVSLDARQKDLGAESLYSCDQIGSVQLAKASGKEDLYLLRRSKEPQLEPEERESILDSVGQRVYSPNPANTFRVVCGVVTRRQKEKEPEVVLVKRHPNEIGLDWMFPSGTLLHNYDPRQVVCREVIEETGLTCIVSAKITERASHPRTELPVEYYHLEPIDESQDVVNGDPAENADAKWVPIPKAISALGDDLFAPVREYLAKL